MVSTLYLVEAIIFHHKSFINDKIDTIVQGLLELIYDTARKQLLVLKWWPSCKYGMGVMHTTFISSIMDSLTLKT